MLEAVLVSWGLAKDAGPVDAPVVGPTFALAYEPDGDCPSRASFEAAILARAPKARRAEPSEQAEVSFQAIASAPPGQKRRLRAQLRDGSSQDREIDADDCAEAVQSMAVIAAMILASRPVDAEPAVSPAPPVEAPRAPVSDEAGAKPPRTESPAPPLSRARRPTWLSGGVGLGLEGAAAPSPTYAISPFAELGSVTTGVLAPSARLTLVLGQSADATSDIGDASFRLLTSRLHLCGLRFGVAAALELRLCAVVDAGFLLADGKGAVNEREQLMPWLGAGLGAIGSWTLGARWGLELGGGSRALLTRDRFVFAPDTEIHQPPVFAWDFRLALTRRVW